MPAITPFIHGNGPVVPGSVWPFVCIVIMCGALSGFHALVSSGTTPKMIARERDILPIGYGAMLLEGFVSVTALIAACALEPGDYFKINIDAERYAAVVAERQGRSSIGHDAQEFDALQASTGERNLAGKTGGAVTLAVGMAKVFSSLPGMRPLMGYWYHFVIMFEALFILTLLETGTRVARFIFQETVRQFLPKAPAGTARDVNLESTSLERDGLLCGAICSTRAISTALADDGHRQSLPARSPWPSARPTCWHVAKRSTPCARAFPGVRRGHGIHGRVRAFRFGGGSWQLSPPVRRKC